MAAYPTALASFLGFTGTHTLAADLHSAQHNQEQAEIIATQTKVGLGVSAPTNNTVLRGNGAGTSIWDKVALASDVSGILPTANGGNGTSSTTGTGSAVFSSAPTIDAAILTGSPVLTTPTIASFVNANHNHTNSAGGGTLPANAMPALDFSVQTVSRPIKFRVYRTGAWTTSNGSLGVIPFETKDYDTSSNVDIVTNKGRFTATTPGYYIFMAAAQTTLNNGGYGLIALLKNGVEYSRGNQVNGKDGSVLGNTIADGFPLLNGDYVEVGYQAVGNAGSVGAAITYFSGFKLSDT